MPKYWVVQANPEGYYKIDLVLNVFIPTKPGFLDWWQVCNRSVRQQDCQPVKQGDYLFIWKADAGKPGSRGIYAVAMAITDSKYGAPRSIADMSRLKGYYVKETYLRGTRPVPHVDMVYLDNLVRKPVLARPELEALWQAGKLPGLAGLVRVRVGNKADAAKLQGENIFSPCLPESEGKFLLGLIRARGFPQLNSP